MISAALLFCSGRSETVSWQVCCAVNIAPTEGLFDSFLRRAILPSLGRSRKALFPYRESYKSDETPHVVCGNSRFFEAPFRPVGLRSTIEVSDAGVSPRSLHRMDRRCASE